MTDFSGILFALSIAAAIVLTIIFIVKHVKKQPTKKIKASIGICLMVAILMVIIGVATMPDSSTDTTASTNDPVSSDAQTVETESSGDDVDTSNVDSNADVSLSQRQVAGKAVDLGAGTFTTGKDVQSGLYDVTPVQGQGNFIVNDSSDKLKINKVLGTSQGIGVSKVRVEIAEGDKIQLQSINKAHFEPVTTPYITEAKSISLYSGVWKAGKDIAIGRYKAVPASGSGNFIVYDQSGMPKVNEVLGGDAGGVKEVTFDIEDGDIINIANLNQVNITPVN